MQNAVIKKGAKVYNAIIAQDVEIGENAVVGEPCESCTERKITVIGADSKIEPGETIKAGEIIDRSEEGDIL